MMNEIEIQEDDTLKNKLIQNDLQKSNNLNKSSYYEIHRDLHDQSKVELNISKSSNRYDNEEFNQFIQHMNPTQLSQTLIQAIQEDEEEQILTIINKLKTYNPKPKLTTICDKKSQTYIHLLCMRNKPKILADILQFEQQNSTNNTEFIDWLNKPNIDAFSALHLAAYWGAIECLQLLKDYGADINRKNEQGQNAFCIAAQGDQVASMVWLRLQGLSFLDDDDKGGTPLHWSTFYGSEFAVQFLLSWISKLPNSVQLINSQDEEGNTALHLAAQTGNQRLTKKLIYKGANRDIKNNSQQDVVQVAIDNQNEIIVQMLSDSHCLYEFLNIKTSIKPASISWSQILTFFFLYIFCIFGTIIFVYPFFDTDYWLQGLSLLSFILGLIFYFLTMFVNPGYIKKSNDLQQLLDLLKKDGPWELCAECQITKPLRSRHCEFCSRCVIVYDHHCPWVHNCIGAKNYPYFLTFIIILWINAVHIIVINGYYITKNYDTCSATYSTCLNSNIYSWFNSIVDYKDLNIAKEIVQGLAILFCLLFFVPLSYLVYVQLDNLFKNLTTFEKYKLEENQANGGKQKRSDKQLSTSNITHDHNQGTCQISNCCIMCCMNSKNPTYQ